MGFDVVGDAPGVLDGFAVHLEDGEGAVGGVDEVDLLAADPAEEAALDGAGDGVRRGLDPRALSNCR